MQLLKNDLDYVVRRLPRDVRRLLSENPGKLFVGGGFIRATIAGEAPSDVDMFGANTSLLQALGEVLVSRRSSDGDRVRSHVTKNAITVLAADRLPVQFITRWTFADAAALVASFDFTVCQAAIWREGNQSNSPWASSIGAGFYPDLAGRRLVYTFPQRDEEAGGSLMRALKYTRRGYSIQVSSLGGVIARLTAKIRESGMTQTEQDTATVIAGLLREVDPLSIVDGLDMVDEHETEI